MIAQIVQIEKKTCAVFGFFISGIPLPWKAPTRRAAWKPGERAMMGNLRVQEWQNYARVQINLALTEARSQYPSLLFPHTSEVRLKLIFKLPAKKGQALKYHQPIIKPDLTNCQKALEDALKGSFFDDDSRCCEIRSMKEWAPLAQSGVWVEIVLVKPKQKE